MDHVNISLMGICFKSCTYYLMSRRRHHRSGYSLSGLSCCSNALYQLNGPLTIPGGPESPGGPAGPGEP